ncbi:prepilin-type N-terminal cleavage/methylation domain-containing protein [Exiguobacterium aestuarii]|uniref:Prepilin-type N-terminal cleavage/methylation domain-containing protein n=1 Tax=Exiguobacterium aestuarii TaxID=273527 RepID=A0ABW2PLS7_9BACL|nr:MULTISPECIES: prepilin-type N-terminal cleavage/methylation domain-containing protein [Exiguobacterium]MCT4785232.1 prepilin-type N-terminal cleavage/methylation domain-containing protein [Exiguobacterium aestuarii]
MVEKLKMIWQDAKQLKDERGLTLVELLVVVVILGIIAAIAVVAIGGIIENSKKDAMVADARQMISAAKLYSASNPGDHDLVFLKAGATASDDSTEEEGYKYISKLEDPFNDASYKAGSVAIAESGGKYTYTVTLKGSKFNINGVEEGSLSKSSLSTP